MTKTNQLASGQTRAQSGLETILTNIIGFSSSVALQVVLFPLYGIHINLAQNTFLSAIAYVIALPRTYLLRRLFNRWHRNGHQLRWQSMAETGIDLIVGYWSTVLMLSLLIPLLGYSIRPSKTAHRPCPLFGPPCLSPKPTILGIPM